MGLYQLQQGKSIFINVKIDLHFKIMTSNKILKIQDNIIFFA